MTAFRPLTVICTFTFGAMLCMGSLPFMVGGFVEQLGFSLVTAGRLGTFALLAGYGLGPALISTLLRAQGFQSALFWTQGAFASTLITFALAFYLLRTLRPVRRAVGPKM
jgi:hypothetical protein